MGGLDWAWKDPDNKDTGKVFNKPKPIFGRKRKKKARKQAKKNLQRLPGDEFYVSKEWRTVRYRVIKKYAGACMACGRTKKDHGIVIHVDHIKPRSIYPDLALTYDNLQLLCEDCNLGKSNKCEIDWRPKEMREQKNIIDIYTQLLNRLSELSDSQSKKLQSALSKEMMARTKKAKESNNAK